MKPANATSKPKQKAKHTIYGTRTSCKTFYLSERDKLIPQEAAEDTQRAG